MNIEKIKEIIKNKKVQAVSRAIAGALIIAVTGTMILHNKNVENKSIVAEKTSTEENEAIKNELEELKNTDTSNMTEEEKQELENKIQDTEQKLNDVTTDGSNSSNTTVASNGTSTNQGSSEVNNEKKEATTTQPTSNTNNNTGNENKSEHTHTHSWVEVYKDVNHAEEGHYENVLVKAAWTESVPVYEEQPREICNGCGADITEDPYTHNENHMLNGEAGGWSTIWKKVQVGTNTITHDAVYEQKWVVDKAAWTEKVLSGYKCNSCGATK